MRHRVHVFHGKDELFQQRLTLFLFPWFLLQASHFQENEVQGRRHQFCVPLVSQRITADVPFFNSSFVFVLQGEVHHTHHVNGL